MTTFVSKKIMSSYIFSLNVLFKHEPSIMRVAGWGPGWGGGGEQTEPKVTCYRQTDRRTDIGFDITIGHGFKIRAIRS